MKIAIASIVVLTVAGLGVVTWTPAEEAALPLQEQATTQVDADILYTLVAQAREDLRNLRVRAGLDPATGRRVRPEQESMSTDERQRQARRVATRGEGGEEGEEGGWIERVTRSNEVYANGARLDIAYDEVTQSFIGEVRNETRGTLSQVRVEVHLSSGAELGPTKRTDLRPGGTLRVELGAIGHQFTHWITHPEAGEEAGHEGGEGAEGGGHEEGREGGEHEGRERGEHGGEEGGEEGGEGLGNRPRDANLRVVYNELQVLRGEIAALLAYLLANR